MLIETAAQARPAIAYQFTLSGGWKESLPDQAIEFAQTEGMSAVQLANDKAALQRTINVLRDRDAGAFFTVDEMRRHLSSKRTESENYRRLLSAASKRTDTARDDAQYGARKRQEHITPHVATPELAFPR